MYKTIQRFVGHRTYRIDQMAHGDTQHPKQYIGVDG